MRILKIFFAYLTACAAVSLPMSLISAPAGLSTTSDVTTSDAVLVFFGLWLLFFLVVFLFAAIPFCLTAFISEINKFRRFWIYLVSSSTTSVVVGVLVLTNVTVGGNASISISEIEWYHFVFLMLLGAIGGAVYWFLAGRFAGGLDKENSAVSQIEYPLKR
ncbi:MAG: hypothetical protein AAGA50_11450 [Pseudomonadota bacterium]